MEQSSNGSHEVNIPTTQVVPDDEVNTLTTQVPDFPWILRAIKIFEFIIKYIRLRIKAMEPS